MSNNENYNRNEHNGSDNNNQSSSKVHGGELKNGRLSQVKNHNVLDEQIPNEYLDKKDPPDLEDYDGYEIDTLHIETP
ncbi:MAG: hypothetical protein WDZ91_02205 [Paenibacillaceae bacterium]